jgi:arylformamidase
VTDWDDAYANAAHIPDGADYPGRWAAAAAEYRAVEQALGRAMLNLRYGEGEREIYDLIYPAGRPEGLVVFIHGGYWLKFDKSFWSHLAAGPAARGWAVAMPSYTLAPEARISGITRQVARAVAAAAGRVQGPVVIAGHSAGGHLAARMLCADVALPVLDRVISAVPISPLSDLRPLMLTSMNADLGLDEAEAKAESPVFHPAPAVPVHVWVGAAERPAFLDQARWLSEAWDAQLTVVPARHHFDVIEELAEPGSPLTGALLGS